MTEIPRIIHQIWLGGSMPPRLKEFCETWKRLHPTWQHRLWTEADFVPGDLRNGALYRDAESLSPGHAPQMRSDILRYEILLEHGGVYVDTDMEAMKPIDGLLEGITAFVAWEAPGRWANNAIMGAVPGHLFLAQLVGELDGHARRRAGPGVRPNVLTGPQFVTPIVQRFPDTVHVFPKEHFYPYLWSQLDQGGNLFPDAYAVHHWNNARKRYGVPLPELNGLMTPEACDVLRELAAGIDPALAIVEIGSFKGMSTCHLALGAQSGGGAHVWAVDPWDLPGNVNGRHGFARREVREEFERQLVGAGIREHVTSFQGFSTDVASRWPMGRKIGMLYIDGDHSREAVLADFRAWRPFLAPGALVVFDDWGTPKNPGVAGAVKKLRLKGDLRVLDIQAERLAVCEVL